MSSVTLKLHKYHPGQALLDRTLKDPTARYVLAAMGRKWGKTDFALNYLAEEQLTATSPFGVWQSFWVAPTYKLAMIGWIRYLDMIPPELILKKNQSDFLIQTINGNRCWWRSSDNPDGLVGEDLDFCIVDEASRCADDVWFRHLAPNLTARKGKGFFPSTPKGRNWFWKLFQLGQSGEAEHLPYRSFNFPTVGEFGNPYVDAVEIEMMRKVMPDDWFRENYLGEFLAESAGVFRNIRSCVRGTLERPKPNCQYVLGWDCARWMDWSVMHVMNASTTPWTTVAWERFQGLPYDKQLDRVAAMAERYNNGYVLMDATHGSAGDPLLEQLKKRHTRADGFTFTGVSKQELIQRLMVALEQEEVTFPEITQLIQELEAFEYELTPSGNIRYGVQEGWNDDCVIALALAVVAAERVGKPLQIRSF